MTTFFAQPYDISACGFFFDTAEQFEAKIGTIRNDYGQLVEEFEIQFIDGESLDAELAKAFEINQANICQFIERLDDWPDDQKICFIIAVGECGYAADHTDDPYDFDLDIYEVDSLKELAEQFVDDGLYGPIPDNLQYYIDYDAIARDLSVEFSETTVDGKCLIYCCR